MSRPLPVLSSALTFDRFDGSNALNLSDDVASGRVDQSSFDRGDTAFVILSSALILFMIPGLAFLYGGLARRKNALHLLWAVVFSNAVVVFQWYLWGYSLAFSRTASNGFIGNLYNIGLRNILADASPGSPLVSELLYSLIQMEFACVTVAILVGAIAERGRVIPAMIFSFVWTTVVYCVIAQWAWGIKGWAAKWGVLDFSGGGPVEICSGFGGLAYAFVLGPRRRGELFNFRAHNISFVCLGTFILWFGWIGFNAGSAYGANLRAVYSAWNSNICAAMGGLVWCLLDSRVQGKFSMVSFCCGTISGLVASTPSSGFIPTWASIFLGIAAGVICNYATKLKYIFGTDDSLDIFAQHGVGGIIGLLANGIFAADYVISLDNINTTIKGAGQSSGCIQNNCKQLYIQFVYICAAAGYTFVVTALLAKVFDLIPYLKLRASEDAETIGMDEDQIGEFVVDFVELLRDFDSTPPARRSRGENGQFSFQIANIEKAAQGIGRSRGPSIIDIGHSPDSRSGFGDFESDSRYYDKKFAGMA